jgi:hypothetical protein
VIDTSGLAFQEQVNKVLTLALKKIEG